MKYVVGLGDFLVSLSPSGYLRFMQADNFDVFYTGAEANVCASLAQFGVKTQFVTRLPKNDIAATGVANLRKYNVGTDYIAYGGDRIGALYLERGAAQRPSKVIYDRKHSGICEATPEHFDFDAIFADAKWFHFTGITPALSDTTPAVCEEACKAAKKYGVTISCDLNYRKNLWTTAKAKEVMEKLLPYVDVLIANEEDAEKVLGLKARETDVTSGVLNVGGYVDVAKQITETFGVKYVATTLRKSISASDNLWSAMLYHDGKSFVSREYAIHIVNRVGGGDSFGAGLIYGMLQDWDEQQVIEFATAASCLKHSIENDFNIASVDEVMTLVKGDGSGRVQR